MKKKEEEKKCVNRDVRSVKPLLCMNPRPLFLIVLRDIIFKIEVNLEIFLWYCFHLDRVV